MFRTALGALSLTALVVSSPAAAAETQFTETQWVLGCTSLDVYQRLAVTFDKRHPFSYEHGSALDTAMEDKTCNVLADSEVSNKWSHVESAMSGYICSHNPREPRCYWVDLSKTRYLGHGPGLSSEQFTEVEKLIADIDALRAIKNVLSKEIDAFNRDEKGNIRQLDHLQRMKEIELNLLYQKVGRQEAALGNAAQKIVHEPTVGPWISALADPEAFQKLRGSVQTVPRPVWACPGWGPGTPVDGIGTRLLTQMEERQCLHLETGTSVRIDEIGGSARVCVAPVGSVRPCQWLLALDLDASFTP